MNKDYIYLSLFLCFTLHSINLYAQCPSFATILRTQSDVDSFQLKYPDCQHLEGELYLGALSFSDSSSNIKNLNGLLQLSRINGGVSMIRLDSLVHADGLNNVEYIGGDLFIKFSEKLKGLRGFSSLDTISGSLVVENCDSLESMLGLDSLSFIGNDISIVSNGNLRSLNGLENITMSGGSIFLRDLPLLSSLDGLQNLEHVGGFYEIDETGISNFSGMEKLRMVDRLLDIDENVNLLTLEGLNNVDSLGGALRVVNNSSLMDCSVLCRLITEGKIEGNISILFNASGCSNIQEIIEDGCFISTSNPMDQSLNFEVFPNPAESQIYLRSSYGDLPEVKVIIRNAQGNTIVELACPRIYDNTDFEIDLNSYQAGIYYISIFNQNGVQSKSFTVIK